MNNFNIIRNTDTELSNELINKNDVIKNSEFSQYESEATGSSDNFPILPDNEKRYYHQISSENANNSPSIQQNLNNIPSVNPYNINDSEDFKEDFEEYTLEEIEMQAKLLEEFSINKKNSEEIKHISEPFSKEITINSQIKNDKEEDKNKEIEGYSIEEENDIIKELDNNQLDSIDEERNKPILNPDEINDMMQMAFIMLWSLDRYNVSESCNKCLSKICPILSIWVDQISKDSNSHWSNIFFDENNEIIWEISLNNFDIEVLNIFQDSILLSNKFIFTNLFEWTLEDLEALLDFLTKLFIDKHNLNLRSIYIRENDASKVWELQSWEYEKLCNILAFTDKHWRIIKYTLNNLSFKEPNSLSKILDIFDKVNLSFNWWEFYEEWVTKLHHTKFRNKKIMFIEWKFLDLNENFSKISIKNIITRLCSALYKLENVHLISSNEFKKSNGIEASLELGLNELLNLWISYNPSIISNIINTKDSIFLGIPIRYTSPNLIEISNSSLSFAKLQLILRCWSFPTVILKDSEVEMSLFLKNQPIYDIKYMSFFRVSFLSLSSNSSIVLDEHGLQKEDNCLYELLKSMRDLREVRLLECKGIEGFKQFLINKFKETSKISEEVMTRFDFDDKNEQNEYNSDDLGDEDELIMKIEEREVKVVLTKTLHKLDKIQKVELKDSKVDGKDELFEMLLKLPQNLENEEYFIKLIELEFNFRLLLSEMQCIQIYKELDPDNMFKYTNFHSLVKQYDYKWKFLYHEGNLVELIFDVFDSNRSADKISSMFWNPSMIFDYVTENDIYIPTTKQTIKANTTLNGVQFFSYNYDFDMSALTQFSIHKSQNLLTINWDKIQSELLSLQLFEIQMPNPNLKLVNYWWSSKEILDSISEIIWGKISPYLNQNLHLNRIELKVQHEENEIVHENIYEIDQFEQLIKRKNSNEELENLNIHSKLEYQPHIDLSRESERRNKHTFINYEKWFSYKDYFGHSRSKQLSKINWELGHFTKNMNKESDIKYEDLYNLTHKNSLYSKFKPIKENSRSWKDFISKILRNSRYFIPLIMEATLNITPQLSRKLLINSNIEESLNLLNDGEGKFTMNTIWMLNLGNLMYRRLIREGWYFGMFHFFNYNTETWNIYTKYDDLINALKESKSLKNLNIEELQTINWQLARAKFLTYNDTPFEYINPVTLWMIINNFMSSNVLMLKANKIYIDLRENSYKIFNYSKQNIKLLVLNAKYLIGFNWIDSDKLNALFEPELEKLCDTQYWPGAYSFFKCYKFNIESIRKINFFEVVFK